MDSQRVAVITGGGRGLGKAAALRLAQDGRIVVIAEIGDYGEATAVELRQLGHRALFIPTDVANRSSVELMIDRTARELGRLDVLVNCAGVLGTEKPFLETTDDEWSRILGINLTGVFYCCRAAIPHMLPRQWGRIVTISSGARRGAATLAPYASSKGGVVGLMRSIANAYAKQGILANCVEPGRALTDMVVPRFTKEFLANPPVAIGRYADPVEIAEVVSFLCSEASTYATGAVWKVGGQAG
jgi:NAD(P)-dependent dehydrogenase (short-subunit alcohol dehydrogenase family)